MTGIVYQLTDNRILTIIPDVLEVMETSIKGAKHEVRGIDTSLASIRVISPHALHITQEDIVQEVPTVEETDGVPMQVMRIEVVGQREIVKIVLAEGGPEIGEGDMIDPATLMDTRALLPKTKDQEIADLKAMLQAAETDNLNTMLALTEVYEMMIGGV